MRRRILFPFFFLSLSLVSSPAPAAVGGETWFTLPTGHFRVHFTAPQEPFAREFARHLERALPALEKDLGWRPRTPIDIVVNDRSDSTNGLAASFPNTHIEVWPVPFPAESSLGDYTNWIEELAIHELAHIVANDTARGAWSGLRSVFGSVVKPNGLQPPWLVEGLAVYFETRFTSGGRGRSPLTEAVLRSAIRNRLFDDPSYLTLDRLNEGPFWWPDGHTPYLVGYALQASLAAQASLANPGASGDSLPFPGAFSQKNAARFPWTPNILLEEMKGFDWAEAWKRLGDRLRARWPEPPPVQGEWLTRGGAFTGGHALSPDGWIYFTLSHSEHGHWLARVDARKSVGNAENVELLVERERPGSPQVAVSPDGSRVAFTDAALYRSERLFWDLWIWENGSARRLTHGLRAFDPAFLSRGDSLLFVRNMGDGRQSLSTIRLDAPDSPEALFTAEPFERLSHPSVRGSTAFFTRHLNDGREEIWQLDLATRKASPLTGLRGDRQRNPQPADDGTLLYTSWSRSTNAWSLWRRSSNGTSRHVASSESGYLGRSVATPQGIVAQDYHHGGFGLRLLGAGTTGAAAAADASTGEPPRPDNDLHRYLTGDAPAPLPERASVGDAPVPYSVSDTAATSLWPQYWLPLVTSTIDGTLLGAVTSGNDPLRYHGWGASLQYDTRAPFPTWNAFYSNRATGNVLRLQTKQWNNWFSSTKEANREEMHLVDFTVPANHWAFSFGTGIEAHSLSGSRVRSGFLFHATRWENEWAAPEAMEPNKGGFASLTLLAHPASRWEGTFSEIQPSARVNAEGFLPSHTASLAAHGGFSTNRLLASNYYQGGGPSALSPSPYVVRGYPVDALLGQRILTVNAAYVLPVQRIWRGSGTAPWFVKQAGVRIAADAGTATWVASFDAERNFRSYANRGFGKRVLTGAGTDFLLTGTVLHHVPVRIVFGVHQGFQRREGGDTRFYLGLEGGAVLP